MTRYTLKLREVRIALTMAALAFPQLAQACATCMGAPGTTQSESVNVALLTMLGMLSVVVGCGAFFVLRMVLLARRAEATPPSPHSASTAGLREELKS